MSREGPERVEQPRHRPGRLGDEQMDAQALTRDHVLAAEIHRLRTALEFIADGKCNEFYAPTPKQVALKALGEEINADRP